MGAGGGGAGFGAGIARGFGLSYLRRSAEQRADTRRKEDQAHEADKFLFQHALNYMNETGDPTAANAMLERLSPDLAKQFKKQGVSPLDSLAPMLQRANPQQQRTNAQSYEDAVNATRSPAGAAAPIYNSAPDRISAGAPTPPPPTFMGMAVPTPEQRMDQEVQQAERVDAATLRRRQGHLQALAAAGQPVSPQGMQEYLLTGKFTLPRVGLQAQRTPAVTAATQFDAYVAEKKAAQEAAGKPWTPADTLATRTEWEHANDPAKTGGAAGPGAPANPEDLSLAAMVVRNPSVLQGWTPTEKGKVMRVIASNPQLAAQYEETRGAAIKGSAQTTLDALKDLVQVDATGQVTGLTPGAAALYGTSVMDRALSYYPGSPGARARASLNQITGQQVLDLIKQLKEQSPTGATGFGQLAVRELNVLEAAATRLKSEIGTEGALPLLKAVYDNVQKILAPSPDANVGAPATPPGATPATSTPGGGAQVVGGPAGPSRATKTPTGWTLSLP